MKKKKLHNNFLMIYIFENKRTTIAEGEKEKKKERDPQLDGENKISYFFFSFK